MSVVDPSEVKKQGQIGGPFPSTAGASQYEAERKAEHERMIRAQCLHTAQNMPGIQCADQVIDAAKKFYNFVNGGAA